MAEAALAVGEWLKGEGPEADIVVSTRMRLARNLEGFPFLSRAGPAEARRVSEILAGAVQALPELPGLRCLVLEGLPTLERLLLVERHLISREHAEGEGPRQVAFGPGEAESLMINEEDHLRLQVLRAGLRPDEAWSAVSGIDDALQRTVPFAWSRGLGFLTACPSNAGTGLRVSVMAHLPALVLTRQIEKVFQAAAKLNLAVRGLYGEGTQASGDFYQISNQVSLGRTEEELVEGVKTVIPTIILYERRAREEILARERPQVEDKIFRAWGILTHARVLSSEEAMHWLSLVRMGVHYGLIRGLEVRILNELFLHSLPAHLQKLHGKKMEAPERNVVRAEFLRGRLGRYGPVQS